MGKYSSMMCACAWLIIRMLGVWLGTEMIISECLVIQLYHISPFPGCKMNRCADWGTSGRAS